MEKLRVRDLMTKEVVAVRPEDDLATLYELMLDHNVRHIPVVGTAQDLIGLVSHRDLLRSSLIERASVPDYVEEALLKRLTVREVMTEEVATVEAGADLREAAALMFEKKYGCLPVTDGERLVGILTESDFVRFMSRGN